MTCPNPYHFNDCDELGLCDYCPPMPEKVREEKQARLDAERKKKEEQLKKDAERWGHKTECPNENCEDDRNFGPYCYDYWDNCSQCGPGTPYHRRGRI